MQLLVFFEKLELELVIADPEGVGITVAPIKFGTHLMELQAEAQRPTQQQGQCD